MIYKGYDKILISSQGLKNIIEIKKFKNKIIFFPNWADKEIEYGEGSSQKNFQFNDEDLKIMYLGNLGKAQDFNSVIKAFVNLKEKNVKLYIIGGGRYKEKIKSMIEINQLSRSIKLIPYQDAKSLVSIGKQSDLFLLTLSSKNIFRMTLPAKLQTYMCIGKPIIGIISGEARLIINNQIGVAVDSGDYIKLAEEITPY